MSSKVVISVSISLMSNSPIPRLNISLVVSTTSRARLRLEGLASNVVCIVCIGISTLDESDLITPASIKFLEVDKVLLLTSLKKLDLNIEEGSLY